MPQLELDPVSTVERGCLPHSIESDVRRALLSTCGLNFASLVVRRIPNGVCLEGVLTRYTPDEDVAAAAQSVEGVVDVQNHLLLCNTDE
ncbi:MAG: BON domain-containing protein [Planctomycetaceae bacterium]